MLSPLGVIGLVNGPQLSLILSIWSYGHLSLISEGLFEGVFPESSEYQTTKFLHLLTSSLAACLAAVRQCSHIALVLGFCNSLSVGIFGGAIPPPLRL